jgi:hypothetical protein
MKIMKPKQLGHYIGNSQYEEGTTVLNPKDYEILKEISCVLNHGQGDYLDGLLNCYSRKGLVDFLFDNTRAQTQSCSIDAMKAIKVNSLIEELVVTLY